MEERWLPAVGLLALLLIVPTLLCVGLSGDDDDGDGRPPPRSRVTASDDEEDSVEEDVPVEELVDEDAVDEDALEESLEEESPTGERELFGVVRDDDGAPVAGAEVMREGGSRYDETNEEGRYELGSLPAAELVLTVRAPGYRLAEVTVPDGENGGRDRVDVTLEDGDQPGGLVVDPQGRPLRGATVACEDGDDEEAESNA